MGKRGLGWFFAIAGLLWVGVIVKNTDPARVHARSYRHQHMHQPHHATPPPEGDDIVEEDPKGITPPDAPPLRKTAAPVVHGGDSPPADTTSSQSTPLPKLFGGHSPVICAHRGTRGTTSGSSSTTGIVATLRELCLSPAEDVGAICCGDYDVFFSSDGVPFVGHPAQVAKMLFGDSQKMEALLSHEDAKATSSEAIHQHDAAGIHAVPLKELAVVFEEIFNATTQRKKEEDHKGDEVEHRHVDPNLVFFSLEPKLPQHPAAGVYLQQIASLVDAIASEVQGEESLVSIILDPSLGAAAKLRDTIPSALRFVAPLKDRILRKTKPHAPAKAAVPPPPDLTSHNATQATKSEAALHGALPVEGDMGSLEKCLLLTSPPSWAAILAPSVVFLETCIRLHREELVHAIAAGSRHGRSAVVPLEVWLVDSPHDADRAHRIAAAVPSLRASWLVSNEPVAIAKCVVQRTTC